MKLDHHEEIFRKTLQEHYAPLDTRTLWRQIESRIESEPEDRKPFFLWWIFGGLSVFAILAVAIFLFNRTDSIPTLDHEKAASAKELTATNSHGFIDKGENKLLNSSSKLPSEIELNINKETSTSKVVVEKKENQAAKNADKAGIIKQTITKKMSDERYVIAPEFKTSKADILTDKLKVNDTEWQPSADQTIPPVDQTIRTTEPNSPPANANNSGLITPTYIEPIETISEQPIITRAKQATPKLDPRMNDSKIISKINFVELQALISNQVDLTNDVVLSPLPIIEERKQRWAVFAEVGQGSYSLKNSNLESVVVSQGRSSIEDLRVTRKFQNLAFGIDYSLGRKFSLQTGFSYTRFNDETQFSDGYEVSTFDNGREDIFFVNDTLDVSNGAYTTYSSVREINESISKNLFRHYIDIPVSIAYNNNIGRRWSVGASIGALINIKRSTNGSFLDSENKLISSDANSFSSSTLFDNSSDTQINYSAGVVVGYNVSPMFQIYVKPSTKYIRNFGIVESTSSSQQGLESSDNQSIWANGLNIGVRLRLN